jgi:hypothetical protein
MHLYDLVGHGHGLTVELCPITAAIEPVNSLFRRDASTMTGQPQSLILHNILNIRQIKIPYELEQIALNNFSMTAIVLNGGLCQ